MMKRTCFFGCRLFYTFVFTVLLFSNGWAQDTLVNCEGDEMIGKVMETTKRNVRFKTTVNGDSKILVLKYREIYSIGQGNGQEINKLKKSCFWWDSIRPLSQTAIKGGLVSPLFGFADLMIESAMWEGTSMELRLGYIDTDLFGRGANTPSKGFFIQPGFKYMLTNDKYRRHARHLHPLRGLFVRADLLFSTYTQKDVLYQAHIEPADPAFPNYLTNRKITTIGVIANIGYQFVLSKDLMFGCNFGLGGGAILEKLNNPPPTGFAGGFYDPDKTFEMRHFSHSGGDHEVPVYVSVNAYLAFVIRHKKNLFGIYKKEPSSGFIDMH